MIDKTTYWDTKMVQVAHLPSDITVADIIEIVERDGVVIIDELVSSTWLAEFNSSVKAPIEEYQPHA